MRSISSPNRSSRTGIPPPSGNRSISPPRTANSPGVSTASVRAHPALVNHAANSVRSRVPPSRTTRSRSPRSTATGTPCMRPGNGATITAGRSPSMARRKSPSRAATRSRAGLLSPGITSSAGKDAASIPRSVSSSTASSASSRCGTTKRTGPGAVRASNPAMRIVLLPEAPRAETSPPSATSSVSETTEGTAARRSSHHDEVATVFPSAVMDLLFPSSLRNTSTTPGAEDRAPLDEPRSDRFPIPPEDPKVETRRPHPRPSKNQNRLERDAIQDGGSSRGRFRGPASIPPRRQTPDRSGARSKVIPP